MAPEEVLRPDRRIQARVPNLRRSYERRDWWRRWRRSSSRRRRPGYGPTRQHRPRGRTEEALSSLEEYASVAEGEDAEAVVKLIEAVRGQEAEPERRIFTLGEARALLPRVRELTEVAVERYSRLPGDLSGERQEIVQEWARELRSLGLEIMGVGSSTATRAGLLLLEIPEPASTTSTRTRKGSHHAAAVGLQSRLCDLDQNRHELEPRAVLGVEAVRLGRVHVEHAVERPAVQDRDDDLRAGGRVAGDVAEADVATTMSSRASSHKRPQ
jgi:hypothetical protein